jgi:hypothetical protein
MDGKTKRKPVTTLSIAATSNPSPPVPGGVPQPTAAGGPLADAGLIAEADAAALLGLKVQTLRKWAVQRKGPPRVTVGRRVFHRRASLHAWLAGQEYDPAAARRA